MLAESVTHLSGLICYPCVRTEPGQPRSSRSKFGSRQRVTSCRCRSCRSGSTASLRALRTCCGRRSWKGCSDHDHSIWSHPLGWELRL